MKNHYQIFSIPNDTPAAQISTIYLEKKRQFASNPEIIHLLDEALRVLTDPELRKAYDRSLLTAVRARQAAATPPPRSQSHKSIIILGSLLAITIYGGYIIIEPAAAPIARPSAIRIMTVAEENASPRDESPLQTSPVIRRTPEDTATKPATVAKQYTRREKNPGFDPIYVAWTVYQVVGAKSRGSGVMIERDKIVTNCHVIAGSYKPQSIAAVHSVTGEPYYAEKIAILSSTEDVCLLHVPGAPDYVANWGASNAMSIGARTHTVSFPGREGLSWSSGQLTGRANIRGLDVLLTSNRCRPGVSGGPLFDDEGNVIGISSAGMKFRSESGEILHGDCISIASETAREITWRTLMSLAVAPLRYDGVWSTER